MIRIFLVDDHRILREGLRALLELQLDMRVVGEAEDGHAALDGILQTKPDVALMDITIPKLNGIDAARSVLERLPSVKVIILSVHSDAEHVYHAFQAGAKGYLLKESAGQEVVSAIRAVYQNETYRSRNLTRDLPRDSEHNPFKRLSQREREVLQLAVEGYTSGAIAEKLFLSPKTVETYRSRLMEKLGAQNMPDLVRLAIRYGITPV